MQSSNECLSHLLRLWGTTIRNHCNLCVVSRLGMATKQSGYCALLIHRQGLGLKSQTGGNGSHRGNCHLAHQARNVNDFPSRCAAMRLATRVMAYIPTKLMASSCCTFGSWDCKGAVCNSSTVNRCWSVISPSLGDHNIHFYQLCQSKVTTSRTKRLN